MERNIVYHTFSPVYNENSKILILGTIPSPLSRTFGFYYSHPQNRFWKIISEVLQKSMPITIDEKKQFLYLNQIALWDVLESCEIQGADDSSIKNPKVNNVNVILEAADINAIFTTGTKATALYREYCFSITGRPSISLPSSSPANCRHYTYEKLLNEYKIILEYLNQ